MSFRLMVCTFLPLKVYRWRQSHMCVSVKSCKHWYPYNYLNLNLHSNFYYWEVSPFINHWKYYSSLKTIKSDSYLLLLLVNVSVASSNCKGVGTYGDKYTWLHKMQMSLFTQLLSDMIYHYTKLSPKKKNYPFSVT